MRVRTAGDADTDGILALMDAAGMLAYTPAARDDIERLRALDADLVLVAEDEAGLAGAVLAGYDGRRGWLSRLTVRSDARRRGAGRALVDEAERRLRARGAGQVNVLVFAGNEPALAFWHAAGYGDAAPVRMLYRRLE